MEIRISGLLVWRHGTRTPMALTERLHATYGKHVAEREALVVKLQGRIEALEAENARRRKDSSNSHKPPSSDIVRPPPARAARRQETQDRRPTGASPTSAPAVSAGPD